MAKNGRVPSRRGLDATAWAALVAAALVFHAPARAQAASAAATPPTLVLGTVVPETRVLGRWYTAIFTEAFRRLGLGVKLVLYPPQRLSVVADQGLIDGDVARVHEYQADHPQLIRVDEPINSAELTLYAVSPAIKLLRIEDLQGSALRTTYLRGVNACNRALSSHLPPEQVIDVSDLMQAWRMLQSGRADVICSTAMSMEDVRRSPEFAGRLEAHTVLKLPPTTFHTYLHRKHAALVPRLAQVFRQMHAEGLIERYRVAAYDGPASEAKPARAP